MYIKTFNLILAILSLVFMVVLPVSADEHIKNESSDAGGNNITYTLNTDGVLTISGKGEMADYYLTDSPWNSQKSKVKSVVIEGEFTNIGSGAFSHAENLTNVKILCDIKSIDDYAFNNCFNLSSIELPESVTHIGNYAFSGCKFAAVDLPHNLKSIGESSFGFCFSLSSVDIPSSVTDIGKSAFESCTRLASVNIGSGLSTIGNLIFGGCISLAKIDVSEENENYASDGGVMFSKDKTTLICYPDGLQADTYVIPSYVKNIGSYAIENYSGLKKVVISESVTNIADCAFYACFELETVEIPESVECIGNTAFLLCRALKSIKIPKSVKSIGTYPFGGCESLVSLEVSPENDFYTADENGVLFNKDKTELIYAPRHLKNSYAIPSGVKKVCRQAFYDCQFLTRMEIPSSVTLFGMDAISHCYNINNIYYMGTEEEWGKLWNFEKNYEPGLCNPTVNTPPSNAKIHFMSEMPSGDPVTSESEQDSTIQAPKTDTKTVESTEKQEEITADVTSSAENISQKDSNIRTIGFYVIAAFILAAIITVFVAVKIKKKK